MQNTSITLNNLVKLAALMVPAALAQDTYETVGDTYPGDLCCRLYQDDNYGGAHADACYDYDTYGRYGLQAVDLGDFGDKASSWWCGKSVAYDFCLNGDTSCEMSGAGNARSPDMGYGDRLDVVKLRYYDAAERGAVTVFVHGDCKGTFGRFEVPAAEEQTAWINYDAIWDRVHRSSQLSSVLVPYGYSLKMWAEDGFVDRDGAEVINGPYWATGEQEMVCMNLWQLGGNFRDWNDEIRSFAVYRAGYGASAQGTWQAITTTESINYTYHVGMRTT